MLDLLSRLQEEIGGDKVEMHAHLPPRVRDRVAQREGELPFVQRKGQPRLIIFIILSRSELSAFGYYYFGAGVSGADRVQSLIRALVRNGAQQMEVPL